MASTAPLQHPAWSRNQLHIESWTLTTNNLMVGPIPKDEADRRHLQVIIERLIKAGYEFSPSYLMEYIYTD